MVKEKQWENHRTKVISCIVFGVYLLLLTWLVLFKFAFAIEEIPHLRQLNLIPFLYETSVKPIMHIKEVVYNILVFVPAGVYFTAFLGERKWWKGIGASFLISLSFEIIQWIFSIGVSDITDLLGNTLGGVLGTLLFVLFGKILSKKRMRVINVVGAAVEIVGIALLSALFVANK